MKKQQWKLLVILCVCTIIFPVINENKGLQAQDSSSTIFTNNDTTTRGEGTENSFFGFSTGRDLTSGIYNTLIGGIAGERITTGRNNTYIGCRAGTFGTSASYNICIGQSAGHYIKYSDYNVFVGYTAGYRAGANNYDCQQNLYLGDRKSVV